MSLTRSIKRNQIRKKKTADMKAFYDHADRVATNWEKREKELSEERAMCAFSATLAICCTVLCREFPHDFKPLRGGTIRKDSRLVRFCRAVEDEVNAIDTRTNDALSRYMDKAYKYCGVRFDYK